MILASIRYVPAEVEARTIARGDVLDGYPVREVVAWEQDGRSYVDVHAGVVRTFAALDLVGILRRVVEGP